MLSHPTSICRQISSSSFFDILNPDTSYNLSLQHFFFFCNLPLRKKKKKNASHVN